MRPSCSRVLLTGDTVGGVWTFSIELAEALIHDGIEVLLATFGPPASDSQYKQAAAIAGLIWRHHNSRLEWMEDPWSDIALAREWLDDIVSAYRPGLVHLNTLCHGDLSSRVPVLVTVHSCVDAWWAAVKETPLPQHWNEYHSQVKWSLRAATLLTAPSNAALTDIGRYYHISVPASRAIYNSRKAGLFQSAEKQPFVLSVGRLWDEGKNVKALLDIAGRLPWPVYLAGSSGNSLQPAAALANCNLLGELDTSSLSDWYGRAAIYALPAMYEPFGLSALEAALSKCALVLGDIPSLREIWLDAATYVPPNDADSFYSAIERLISDSDYREQMSQRALLRASQFTQADMVASYQWAYDSAIELHADIDRRRACAS